MSTRTHHRQLQGPCNRREDRQEWEQLTDLILAEQGVECKVIVHTDKILIQAQTPADFYLAKACIKGRVSKDIVRSI